MPSGTAPSSPATPADPATNRLTGYTYDNNGNAYLSGGQYYDAENRLIETNNFDTRYGYDSRNKRIWEGTYTYNGNGGYNQTAAQVFFYGLDGKKLGSYTPSIIYGGQYNLVPQSIGFNNVATNTYFAGRMVQQSGVAFIEDRLGSNGKYFPYGEERNYPALPNDQVKFETYTRDSATGLDYADQRYYSSVLGRFVTSDPYRGSMDLVRPGSLDRYAYSWSDPVNNNDPTGLCIIDGVEYPDPCFTTGATAPSDGGDTGNNTDIPTGSSFGPTVVAYTTDQLAEMAQNKAFNLLTKAFEYALEALQNPDCLALFKSPGGSYLKDPTTGATLDPVTVLKSLYRETEWGGNFGYGFISFLPLNNFALSGTTSGTGLSMSLQGPYYSGVIITMNISTWNWGYTSEDTTTLLHELGHAISDLAAGFGAQNSFANDALSDSASEKNTHNVQDKCTKQLNF